MGIFNYAHRLWARAKTYLKQRILWDWVAVLNFWNWVRMTFKQLFNVLVSMSAMLRLTLSRVWYRAVKHIGELAAKIKQRLKTSE